jgi:hypothetical protein
VTLDDIVARNLSIARPMIGGDRELAIEMQTRLADLGLLDPPADGKFATASHWALDQFLRMIGSRGNVPIDTGIARQLLEADADEFLPVNVKDNLAGRLVTAARNEGYWLSRHPDCVNILYIEGSDADGTPNDDAPNVFNDLRVVLGISRAGNPQFLGEWEATTEPGRFFTSVKKLDPRGAARIKFGQYKSWAVGTHMMGRPTAHEALVQVADIVVFRDLNEDFEREGDDTFTGVFGINQHCGLDVPKGDIGRASAGCLVGRTRGGHREFMQICKGDARFMANNSYKFMTGVLPADALEVAP